MEYRYIHGHVEVFYDGHFILSADTICEADEEIKKLEREVCNAEVF